MQVISEGGLPENRKLVGKNGNFNSKHGLNMF